MNSTIVHGDCIEVLCQMPESCVDLVFADPPFNIGYVYDGYRDDVPDEQYVRWTRDWMAACVRVLKPTGSFYIAIGDEFAAEVRVLGRQLRLHLRNWIQWHYTFGQATQSKFARSHTHIFYFSKDPKRFTFNDHFVRFPSARHTEYQDLRANPEGRLPNDVWTEFPRVCGTFRERAGFHGCQMPEALLQRIVLVSSNERNVVLDPFVGSGATAAAAKRLKRTYVGVDLSAEYVEHVNKRLADVSPELGAPIAPGAWPRLHLDQLATIYRETNVTLDNLRGNRVALDVMSRSLSARCGCTISTDDVLAELERQRASLGLPKLPNDRPFAPRAHTTTTGKKYVRRKLLVNPRRRPAQPPTEDGIRLTG